MMINSQCPPTHKNKTGFTQDGLQTTIFSCSAQLKSRLARNCILHSVPRFLRIHTTSGQNTFAFFCIYSKRYLLSRLRKNLRLFLLCKGARLRDWRKNVFVYFSSYLVSYHISDSLSKMSHMTHAVLVNEVIDPKLDL